MIQTINHVLFSKNIPDFGTIRYSHFDISLHGAFVHTWVAQPYAQYWGMIGFSYQQFVDAYTHLKTIPEYEIYIGYIHDQPSFLVESYNPQFDELSNHISIEPNDRGMHILMAPAHKKKEYFSWHVFSSVLDYLLLQCNYNRVIVEPDHHNYKIHRLNKKAGFKYLTKIQLSKKKAWLAVCTKDDYLHASTHETRKIKKEFYFPKAETLHLIHKQLTAKMISEFVHEKLFLPEKTNHKKYCIVSETIQYEFVAEHYMLDHWVVQEESIKCFIEGKEKNVNAIDFILQFSQKLGIPNEFLTTYMDEINSTLYAKAYRYHYQKYTAQELVSQDFQVVEHAMTEGHPVFIANSGRIGFTLSDFEKYSPDADPLFNLVWLAGHKSRAEFNSIGSIEYHSFIREELGENDFYYFRQIIHSQKNNPDDYIFIPVHPWQWKNKISILYSLEISTCMLIYLGKGKDRYSPQQSIRTLFNYSNRRKQYVKLALSIQNMGFLRGLSAYYMKSTPQITEWINKILSQDDYLNQHGFKMLGEVATVGYVNPLFEKLGHRNSHNKMLAALWRESPYAYCTVNQEVMTMAALLHRDNKGDSFLKHIIHASQMSPISWLESYLQAYLTPLLHCLAKYNIAFMPHGENVLLVHENYIPKFILMKDITEEVIVFEEHESMPEAVKRTVKKATPEMQGLSIMGDVLDGFFRYLAPIFVTEKLLTEHNFWLAVKNTVLLYLSDYPALEEKINCYHIFSKQFKRTCLNRLQLRNTTQMLDLNDPINNLVVVDYLNNPITT
jgi:siderophore synthetase component/RimJ/RimL family protein N-acetyltransferase